MVRVTFDSNVWEKIVAPERAQFDSETFRAALEVVEEALRAGRIQGFIAEAYFTIEAMTRAERAEFLARQGVVPIVVEAVQQDGSPVTVVLAGADESRRPPLPAKVQEVLPGAMELGLRVLPHPRFHQMGLPGEWFAPTTDAIDAKIVATSGKIEAEGLGRARLRAYSLELSKFYGSTESFVDVPNVPMTDQEAKRVAKLAGEWADGEAVACHIGFGNDIFCTEDRAGGALKPSIMDKEHRSWMAGAFALRIMTVEELAASLVATSKPEAPADDSSEESQ